MRVTLKADEGHIYTNGETYGKVIHLAVGVDKGSYYQITMDEYEERMRAKEAEVEANV